eukprot:SAG31_NODE_378_length_16503_cov_28.830041_18_plen_247_part_00
MFFAQNSKADNLCPAKTRYLPFFFGEFSNFVRYCLSTSTPASEKVSPSREYLLLCTRHCTVRRRVVAPRARPARTITDRSTSVMVGFGISVSLLLASTTSSVVPGASSTEQTIRNGTLMVGFDSSRGAAGPRSVSWGNRTVLQSSESDGALTMSWSLRGALFGGAKPSASSHGNQTDGTAELLSAGATPGGAWRETLRYNAVGVTVVRTWRIDAARQEVVCSVQIVATSPAVPLGNPTLLEAWVQV